MQRFFTAAVAVMVIAEGVLVVANPVMAALLAVVILLAGAQLRGRAAAGRRPGSTRRTWANPNAGRAVSTRRAA